MKNWKRRYFRLNAVRLAYFESSEEVGFHFLPAVPVCKTVFLKAFNSFQFTSTQENSICLINRIQLYIKKCVSSYEQLCTLIYEKTVET